MKDRIVIYKKDIWLVKGETATTYIISNRHKEWTVVSKDKVEPYKGDRDAISLGLRGEAAASQ